MKRRVVIAGGGTGGHFYPALALSQALRAQGHEVLALVRREDPACRLLDRENIPYAEVDLMGLPRAVSPRLFPFGWKLAASLPALRHMLRDFAPDAVVAMGGYLGFPLVFAAALRGIPRYVHESNVLLGLANRASVALGATLLRGWPLPQIPGSELTGTPVRPALLTRKAAQECRRALALDPGKRTVLVFGGSQGARALNEAFPEALRSLSREEIESLQVIHLTGRGRSRALQALYDGIGIKASARDYLDDMELGYGAADLVVCRAGASTLNELLAQEKPAVLVPYPHAAADHQTANARFLEARGTVRMAAEGAGFAVRLSAAIKDLLLSNDGALLRDMQRHFEEGDLPSPALAASRMAAAVLRAP
jgi:UDP-N-acetylglucosamine--N-acetylmuramyl-(pentapeptide) pyrophosphoryl-undecaprenol N-acetylglucosamine transferase